jgi:hypothetical protein
MEKILTIRDPSQDRRDRFAQKQAEDARLFELREKVATAITNTVAPLAIDAREAQSAVHIQVRGDVTLPDIRLELDGCGVRDADDQEFREAERE